MPKDTFLTGVCHWSKAHPSNPIKNGGNTGGWEQINCAPIIGTRRAMLWLTIGQTLDIPIYLRAGDDADAGNGTTCYAAELRRAMVETDATGKFYYLATGGTGTIVVLAWWEAV